MADTTPTGLTLTAAQTRELGLLLGASMAAAREAGMGELAEQLRAFVGEVYPDGWTAPATRTPPSSERAIPARGNGQYARTRL